jgi:hypothetical protein
MNARHRTSRLPFLGRRRRATAIVRRQTGKDVGQLMPTRHDGTQGHPLNQLGAVFAQVRQLFPSNGGNR